MSPTVPPISVITMSTSSSAARATMRSLISSVMCGITCTVWPRYVAAALLGEHVLVDRTGGGVRLLRERDVDEALVVAEVEVGLAAVVGDEHLTVLEGVHRARVDVDVRVELLHRDPEAAGLEQATQRRGGEALPEAGGHATGHEDVLRQGLCSFVSRTNPARRSDRRRPYHATRDRPAHRRSIPCRNDPGRDGVRRPRSRRVAPRGTGAATPLILAIVAILIRLPAFFAVPVAGVRRRRVRVVGPGDARRRGAVPRRLLESGAGVPPAGVGRRPRRVPHDERAAGAHASPPACC